MIRASPARIGWVPVNAGELVSIGARACLGKMLDETPGPGRLGWVGGIVACGEQVKHIGSSGTGHRVTEVNTAPETLSNRKSKTKPDVAKPSHLD
jgi:hypothetical protein